MRGRLAIAAGVALLMCAVAGRGDEPLLQGRVVDERGRPIAGAEVYRQWDGFSCAEMQRRREAPEEAATDRDGRFSFPIPHPGEAHLVVFAPGHVALTTPRFRFSSAPASHHLPPITLQRGVVVSGRAIDGRGQPLAGVGIWIDRLWPTPNFRPRRRGAGPPPPEVLTDSEGGFELADLPAGKAFAVSARRSDLSSAYQRNLMTPLGEPLTLVLHDRVRLSGQVLDEDGAPVLVATVSLQDHGPEGTGPPDPLAVDADGRFVLPAVEVGVISLFIEANGFRAQDLAVEVEPGGLGRELVVTLRRTGEVAGRVTLASGEGAAGVGVGFEVEEQRPGCGGEDTSVLTDAQGYYRLAGVPVGTRTIRARRPGGSHREQRVEVGLGGTQLDLVLPPAYPVSGRLVDEHGRPVARAKLDFIIPEQNALAAFALTQEDGSFTTDPLADGVYHISVWPRGGPRNPPRAPLEAISVEVAGGPLTGIELRLNAPAALSVRVVGVAPEEALEVLVSAKRNQWRTVSPRSAELGRYDFTGLEAGEWTVIAYLSTQRRSVSVVVVLEPGAAELVELDLDPRSAQ